jgi:predicted Rossmann-fold nucleotide-binding protein
VNFAKEINFFERAALTFLKGKKIEALGTQMTKLEMNLFQLCLKLHQFHFISPEPHSLIRVLETKLSDRNGTLLGQTNIHPVSHVLHQDAEHLKSICMLKQMPVAEFELLGLDWDKRQSWRNSPDFKTDKVAVLASGDFTSIWQVMSLLRQRQAGAKGPPIIIQNTHKIWEIIFKPLASGWERRKKELRDLNVYFSSGAPETADLLAGFENIPKINPKDINFHLATFPEIKNPLYLFATTDSKKFNEVREALGHSGAAGRIRRAFDILGKSEIPTEQKYSFEGNAAEKMEALIERIRTLGMSTVEQLLKLHGYTDSSEIILMTNDGGLGICLENGNGERKRDLFTPEFFPDTHQSMNKSQMAPGVELAYLMRTIGLQTAFIQLWKSVRSACSKSHGRFKEDNLIAYDTSLQIFLPLKRVLDAIQQGGPLDLQSLGIISVFGGQRLKVSKEPKGPWSGDVETINYLYVPSTDKVRAELPSDVTNWPNAKGFLMLQSYAGTSVPKEKLIGSGLGNNREHGVRLGLLGTPSILFARAASDELNQLKRTLEKEYAVKTRQGADIWLRYKDSFSATISQVIHGNSNSAYRAGIRKLLDESAVIYVGNQKFSTNPIMAEKERILQSLLFLSAVVRNQIFNPIDLVVNKAEVPHLIKLIEHKKRLGLIGQSMPDLMTLIDKESDAAEVISRIARSEKDKITPLDRKFISDGQVENKQCVTTTVYFSASNVNNSLVTQAHRLGYLMAVNGFSLKVGGGNDGLMRAAADGFQKGKAELQTKGHIFPNQLILIQCIDTESIEKAYEGGGIYRCHPTIEAREADLQNTDFVVAGAGGAGTDEEIFAEFYSRLNGLTDSTKKPFMLFNQQIQTKDGFVGVHDPYRDIFDNEFFKKLNVSFVMTSEEILARAVAHRSRLLNEAHVISAQGMGAQLAGKYGAITEGQKVYGRSLSIKRFISPIGVYLGQEGHLPYATKNEPEYRMYRHT